MARFKLIQRGLKLLPVDLEQRVAGSFEHATCHLVDHKLDRYSFDTFIAKYALQAMAHDKLALIVRGADCGPPELAGEAAGQFALAKGLSLTFTDDHEMLAYGMVIYDALYAWCGDMPMQKVGRFMGCK